MLNSNSWAHRRSQVVNGQQTNQPTLWVRNLSGGVVHLPSAYSVVYTKTSFLSSSKPKKAHLHSFIATEGSSDKREPSVQGCSAESLCNDLSIRPLVGVLCAGIELYCTRLSTPKDMPPLNNDPISRNVLLIALLPGLSPPFRYGHPANYYKGRFCILQNVMVVWPIINRRPICDIL